MSPTYYKRRREKLLERSRKGVAARERIRVARNADAEGWRCVRTMIVRVWAAPDGRNVEVMVDGVRFRCGSERAVRGALARVMWGERNGQRSEVGGRMAEEAPPAGNHSTELMAGSGRDDRMGRDEG